ncbi:hypothetical protein TWF730_002685 [Orbilia blumenaviensis]|uniref:Uncharacterized protein n=1 Tax=Orbilia blumenaviensis TaxID=1796055 RepID=A0AAV9U937_9PEZI
MEDDGMTTAQGVAVGVNDGHDTEVDLAGSIKLVGSPFLKKHGDGGGKDLDQNMIIARAFVFIDLEHISSSDRFPETLIALDQRQ